MKLDKGDWEVTRDCCTSGNCSYCMRETPFGKTRRIVQMSNLSQTSAREIAQNWARYKATAQPMAGARETAS